MNNEGDGDQVSIAVELRWTGTIGGRQQREQEQVKRTGGWLELAASERLARADDWALASGVASISNASSLPPAAERCALGQSNRSSFNAHSLVALYTADATQR